MCENQWKVGFIFPGQGSQMVGMGKEFFDNFSIVKETFQEAEDILKISLIKVMLEGPAEKLTETRYSQLAIYTSSVAYSRLLNQLFPYLKPQMLAGHSVGEYAALTVSERIPFDQCLSLVSYRAEYMNDACLEKPGKMAAIVGMDRVLVEEIVNDMQLPNDLWVANYNSPIQVVISGTEKGVEKAMVTFKERGAKMVIPLRVHGAFHSPLMKSAEERLAKHLEPSIFNDKGLPVVMNVSGKIATDKMEVCRQLSKQICSSVKWEQSIQLMEKEGLSLFVEVGCGKVLAGLNKRIAPKVQAVSINSQKDFQNLEQILASL